MTRKKISKKTTTSFEAKDVFLATLGLYGKVYEQGSERAAEANRKREAVFKELVDRGEKLEDQAKEKFEELKAANPALETRFEHLRNNFTKLTENFGKQVESTRAKAKAA